jgi:hypothetical protein
MAVVPQKMRRERSMFSSSDDTAMMKQIQATHAPDGRGREFSVKHLLHIVEDIFLRSTPALGMTSIVQQQVYTYITSSTASCMLYFYVLIILV